MENRKLLVLYISTSGIEPSAVPDYIANTSEAILTDEIIKNYMVIVVPVYGETRVECIDPEYITDSELIKENERLMSQLREKFTEQLEYYEELKNGRE